MTVRGNDERQQLGRGRAAATPDSAPRLAHVTEQPGLPVKFDSKRGCDQIRARIYHDHRLTGLEWRVAMALSEFVRPPAYVAYPKQARLARMVNATRPKVSGALSSLEAKGVLEIDRRRTYCRYVFLAVWRGLFQAVQRPAESDPRCSLREQQDVPSGNITGEPVHKNLVLRSTAAAVLPAPDLRPTDDQQQQRLRRTEDRIEGLFGAIAARARQLRVKYDEQDERARLKAGEIDVDALQRLADELGEDLQQRRVRL